MGRPRLLLWAAAALWLTLAGSTEDASTAERRALLRFRDSTSGWERLEAAAGPGGLPGWAADSPLHHCQWGGVACCSVKDHVADALGGSPAEAAVCVLKLVYQPRQAEGEAAPGNTSAPTPAQGPPPAADLEHLRDLPWLVMLELSGIALSMPSVERLLQPRKPPLQLWSLVLQRASLNAPLPPALLQVPSLREMDLSFAGVQGPLPPQRHCSLQHLNLAGNWELTGALPQALLLNPSNTAALELQALAERGTTFCDVLHLNLSSTGISGQLPELPDNTASSLATLDLSNTRLGSTLPSNWPFNAPYLFYLDLTNASLRGTVPPSWWDDILNERKLGPRTPDFLYLGGNQLTGAVPLGWAAIFTPGDSIRSRQEASSAHRTISDLQARVASHSYRMRYRSEQHILRTALFPGNERLCLQPGQALGLVQARVYSVPLYRALLQHLCHDGGKGRSLAASACLLALMVLLAAAALAGAAYLRHGSLTRRWWHAWRWWRSGYLPAWVDGMASQPRGKEASWHAAVAAAAAEAGCVLELQVRPGRRMGVVLQAIELAQASARASSGCAAEHDSRHAQHAHHHVRQDGLQQQQAWSDAEHAQPSAGAEALPLLPSTALVLPQHEGQPLMLGRTSRSMVMLGQLEGVGEVAVKALHISPQLLAAARREVRLLHRCANRHPNLVQLHGLCHTHPFLLVVTELCAGGDLQSLLHMPEMRWHARGAGVALDVCRGVAFMHSQGVVWADCKPGNVLLTADWQAKPPSSCSTGVWACPLMCFPWACCYTICAPASSRH